VEYHNLRRAAAGALIASGLVLAGACGGSTSGATGSSATGVAGAVNNNGTPGVPPAAAGNQTGTSGGTGLLAATAVGSPSPVRTPTPSR
jgi:hypothetical protein